MNIAGFVQHTVAPHLDRAASALDSIPGAPMHQYDLMQSARSSLQAVDGEIGRFTSANPAAADGLGAVVDPTRAGVRALDRFLQHPASAGLRDAADQAASFTLEARAAATRLA